MEEVKKIAPVLIWKTRSFLLGILPLLLTLIDTAVSLMSAEGYGGPVTAAISAVTGWSPETVRGVVLLASPIWGLIIAQQRAGLARPYTVSPSKAREVTEVTVAGESLQGKL